MLFEVNIMNEVEFDKALSDFLDDEQYEQTSEAMFSLIRAAFTAGWKAALGSGIGKIVNIDRG